MILKDYLRKACDIVFDAVSGINKQNVQEAIQAVYDKAVAADNNADGKLDQATADLRYLGVKEKAVDSDLLDGHHGADFILVANISSAVDSTSTNTVAASVAVKTTHDYVNSAFQVMAENDNRYSSTFEKLASRNMANGYAGLDAAGLLSPNQIPGQHIVNVNTYSSTLDRNNDTALQQGDMAIVESENTASLYILKTNPSGSVTTDADWLILQTQVTIDVRTWNGRNGNVTPALGDYTSALVMHDNKTLDGVIENIENKIPETPGDLDAYSKTECDSRFVNKSVVSDATNSTSSSDVASSKAAKTAYDRGSTALSTANGKLDQATADSLYLSKTGKSVNSDKLDGKDSTYFLSTTGKAADADKLDSQDGSYYRNASNLNAGTVPNARLPATALRTDNQIKDLAGSLDGGSQTRITVNYNTANRVFDFNAAIQSDNNFTNDYKTKLDNLLANQWQVISNHISAKTGDRIIVDMTSVGTLIVTMPANPKSGDSVMVSDGSGLAGQGKTLTIARNSQPIMSLDEDLNFDIPGYLSTFVYLNPVRGWVVMN
ncbi:MAG: hypothetical protein LPD71_00145 [Shewanella sp.]|nr:hypothetical protein [Shewanella sp.]MCF1459474.1 hypothetical protein [Shewanella sp.]